MWKDEKAAICRICKENCGILVNKHGNSVNIRGNPAHPISKGFVCVRGRNFGKVHCSPERLSVPLLKKNGRWMEISYEDALAILSTKLNECKAKHGAQSVVFYKGEALKHQEVSDYLKHLAYGFGTPNYITVGSLCHRAMTMGHGLTYGGIPRADFQRIKCAILWGVNPAVSLPRQAVELKKAVRQGMKLVVVDPSYSQTARTAHLHLPVTPGTDGLLALGFIKHFVGRIKDIFDPAEVNGWEEITSMVAGLSFDEISLKTGISGQLFNKACAFIFDHTPAWIMTGSGLELQPCGVQTIRAIACLQALVDPDIRPGPMSAGLKGLPNTDRYEIKAEPIGQKENPYFIRSGIGGQGMYWNKAILHNDPYPVRAMVVVAGNPLITFPDYAMQKKALDRLDFLAVFDLFITPTAQMADLVFPAADFLQNMEIHDYCQIGLPYLGLIRPVINGEKGWPAWKFLFRLSQRLGLGNLFPWEDNREAINHRMEGVGIMFEDLENSPGLTARYNAAPKYGGPWNTPDGKLNCFSHDLETIGISPLPKPEVLTLPFDTDEAFPFWLSTGDRVAPYMHGQFRNIPEYRELMPEPYLDIHPEAARSMRIDQDEMIVLSTQYGKVTVKVNFCPDVRRDCLRMTHGWEEANANHLSGSRHFDPISGFPWMRALPARIDKPNQQIGSINQDDKKE